MILLLIGAVGVLVVLGLAWLMRAENRRDDRRAGFTQDDHPGFGDITPETVHNAPWPPAEPPAVTLHGALHRQYPFMSPAAPPERTHTPTGDPYMMFCEECWDTCEGGDPCSCCESAPTTSPAAPPPPPGAEQGTAAAAGGSPPPASPPPLPGHIAAHPEQYPFGEWLRDDVAEADCAARALAETAAMVRDSYYKPLGGA